EENVAREQVSSGNDDAGLPPSARPSRARLVLFVPQSRDRRTQVASLSAISLSITSIASAFGAPPCARSLLPPPRPPSRDMAPFISDPMSKGCPADCANTSDG